LESNQTPRRNPKVAENRHMRIPCADRPAEIAPAVDRPCGVEPNGLMCRVDHRLRRHAQWLQCRNRQAPVPCRICLQVLTVSLGEGQRNAIHHDR
jgi:hypothetical protein